MRFLPTLQESVKTLVLFIATGGGIGYFPRFPGTLGSLLGVALFFVLRGLPTVPYGMTLAALFFLACWASTGAEVFFGEKDSHRIVIDEVIGMLVTLTGIPFSWGAVVLGFVLFRVFDIWKPFPVRLVQDRVPRGWGVVGDDVVAGIYANCVIWVLLCVWK